MKLSTTALIKRNIDVIEEKRSIKTWKAALNILQISIFFRFLFLVNDIRRMPSAPKNCGHLTFFYFFFPLFNMQVCKYGRTLLYINCNSAIFQNATAYLRLPKKSKTLNFIDMRDLFDRRIIPHFKFAKHCRFRARNGWLTAKRKLSLEKLNLDDVRTAIKECKGKYIAVLTCCYMTTWNFCAFRCNESIIFLLKLLLL